MSSLIKFGIVSIGLLVTVSPVKVSAQSVAPGSELTLQDAEQLALGYDPAVMAFDSRAQAYDDQAVADGQLPDPRLKLGTMNVPVDTFDFDQESMTQLQVGIQQAFPPGDTLRYRQEYTQALSDGQSARQQERRLAVLQEVRRLYLELYFQVQSGQVLQLNRELFNELRDTTQRQYAAGRNNQHDVLRAQLELSLVDDRILEVQREIEAARGALSRYLPQANAQRPLPADFPALPPLPGLEQVRGGLTMHPLIAIEDAAVLASKKKIDEAEQKYKPGFNVDVTYGSRFGNSAPGMSRPDMLSAMVTVDLPLFTGKRQDRHLAAARKHSQATQFSRTDRLYELHSMLEQAIANWQRLDDRLNLYEQRALADARLNSESTLKAYQSDVADFTTLMRANLIELNTQIDLLRIRTERAKVLVRLHYLAGE